MTQKTDAGFYLNQMPLIAILRGIKPDEILEYAEVIVSAGWRVIEIPLNSPEPFKSIEKLIAHYGDEILIGAGTVLNTDNVRKVAAVGGKVIVAPNTDAKVIGTALEHNMAVMPGFLTPTEAFLAYEAGARYLKLFPADSMGPAYIKAVKSVLPADARIIPVGGVTPETIESYHAAGCAAYGVGSPLYKPGMSLGTVESNAQNFAKACRNIMTADNA